MCRHLPSDGSHGFQMLKQITCAQLKVLNSLHFLGLHGYINQQMIRTILRRIIPFTMLSGSIPWAVSRCVFTRPNNYTFFLGVCLQTSLLAKRDICFHESAQPSKMAERGGACLAIFMRTTRHLFQRMPFMSPRMRKNRCHGTKRKGPGARNWRI